MYVCLVQSLGFSHTWLDVKTLDILPVFLEKRDKEVHGKTDVLHQLLLRHLDVTDGNTQTENFLHLELDGSLHVIDLTLQVIWVGYHGGELKDLPATFSILDTDSRKGMVYTI